MPGSAGQCSNIWGWMTAATAMPMCQIHQAELEQHPSRQRPVCTPVQSGHIPKQCRTAAVMQEPLSCDHCALQADQHWSVGGWTKQPNVASQLHVADSDLRGLCRALPSRARYGRQSVNCCSDRLHRQLQPSGRPLPAATSGHSHSPLMGTAPCAAWKSRHLPLKHHTLTSCN